MKRIVCLAVAMMLALGLTGGLAEEMLGLKMNVRIGEFDFVAILEDNAAVEELVEMMQAGPVTVEMDDYAGFEKVGSLGTQLSADDAQTTTQPGDIVLYNSSNIVMFYGTNAWAYTRIGHIEDLTNWQAALGEGSVMAEFSLEKK